MAENKSNQSFENRSQLYQKLSSLPPQQFNELIFALNPPAGILPGNFAPQGERIVALFEWIESPTGAGLNSLKSILNQIVNLSPNDPADATMTLHRYRRINKGYTEDLGDGVTLTLMLIPAGEFMMGAPEDEPESRANERPQHRVKVPQFLMGRYPVTQAQWRVVAGYDRVDIDLDAEPSRFRGDDLPVESVSWSKAVEFCKRLSKKSGKNYHLPSEAQWEYACRAGTETAYHYGDQITSELANYGREVGQTTPVGRYPANRWGLHDMHGNVREWCQDQWHDNYEGAPSDGTAWIKGGKSSRINRGGSWDDDPGDCRSAYRPFIEPDFDYLTFGFRVCCASPRILL